MIGRMVVRKSQKCFPRLKPTVSLRFFRWTESPAPPAEAGGSHLTAQQITQDSREWRRER